MVFNITEEDDDENNYLYKFLIKNHENII